MEHYYSAERNIQIVIFLLKAHGIKKVIASPGATNVTFIASIQQDPWFEIYSCIDERSAAYMAVGMSDECGEPVVISCTGATSSRNYMPALTEAYYRKIPVIAITSSQDNMNRGHLIAQVTDRSSPPPDTVIESVYVQNIRCEKDEWDCTIKINRILQLHKTSPGPIHLNVATGMGGGYNVKNLPSAKIIKKYNIEDKLPPLPENGHIGIFIGSHTVFTNKEIETIDQFCAANNAIVFCDHTSRYNGQYGFHFSLIGAQEEMTNTIADLSLLINIGEISGDYDTMCNLRPKEVWRVSPDGEFRDMFCGKLSKVFQMKEIEFFSNYLGSGEIHSSYIEECRHLYYSILERFTNIPFSNIYIAYRLSKIIPENSVIYLGILNSLRSWNYFETSSTVKSISNVGGFGIDGIVSSLIGASFCDPHRLYFGILGDLSFFYDMNSLGNRHIKGNVRIMVINNGHGQEFCNYNHAASFLGEDANKFVAAGGHYGNISPTLLKDYAENLNFKYICAKNKEEFDANYNIFIRPNTDEQPVLFEIFTDAENENKALWTSRHLVSSNKVIIKRKIRKILSYINK